MALPRAPRHPSTPGVMSHAVNYRGSGPSTPRDTGGQPLRTPSHPVRCSFTVLRISGPSVSRVGTRGVSGRSAAPACPSMAASITAKTLIIRKRRMALLLMLPGPPPNGWPTWFLGATLTTGSVPSSRAPRKEGKHGAVSMTPPVSPLNSYCTQSYRLCLPLVH